MTPYPGMKIQSEGATGKILTVNGGRVKGLQPRISRKRLSIRC